MSELKLNFEMVANCPLCGNQKLQPYDSARDTLSPELNRYLPPSHPRLPAINNVREKCLGCGLIFLSPRLDPPSLGEIYKLWYSYAYQAIFENAALLAQREYEFKHYHFPLLRKVISATGRLLDVGCGSGIFLRIAREAGWETHGIELDPSATQWARDNYQLAVRCGTVDTALREGEQFDAITLFDYLEHTASPGSDLDQLIRHLSPGGVLCIRVPNQAGLQSHFMDAHWINYISNHLSYFTSDVLSHALSKRGLIVEYANAPNFQSQFDIIRQKIRWARARMHLGTDEPLEQHVATTTVPLESEPVGKLKRFLYSLLVEQIDHAGGWLGRGNNLMLIARRPN